jgi:hypothetical protein
VVYIAGALVEDSTHVVKPVTCVHCHRKGVYSEGFDDLAAAADYSFVAGDLERIGSEFASTVESFVGILAL